MSRLIFNGKNVYIFGGSSGIGLETARLLAGRGANIILFARNKERLDKAVEDISRLRLSKHQKCTACVLDVSDDGAVRAEIARVAGEFGVPQIVINAAGRAIPRRFEDITAKQFDETMKINLYGVWNTVSAVLPFMKEHGGTIVNVSSVGGFVGVFGYADYAASKFAVIGLSEVLRAELKQYNIAVSVLCPPDTNTPGYEAENHTKPAETRMISEGGGLLEPQDVARALLRGMEKGTPVIIPGFEGRMTWYLKRHVPAVVDFIMKRGISKAQQASHKADR